jgi:hypothetical protein
MNGYLAAMSIALPPPDIAWPILVVLILEYMVWPVLTQFVPDVPRCPLCESSFRWSDIDTYDTSGRRQPRPFWFPCPTCQQTIGVPGWRKPFLLVSYLALIITFMFLIFGMRGDLFLGFLGTLVAAVGAIRIADWFIWRRLEPGRPLEDNPSLWT